MELGFFFKWLVMNTILAYLVYGALCMVVYLFFTKNIANMLGIMLILPPALASMDTIREWRQHCLVTRLKRRLPDN